MKRRWLLLSALLPLLPACIDELPSGVRLERPRVLGARTEIDGDPGRAWPRPGEAATLRFYTATRDGEGFAAALSACVEAPSLMGVAGCAGEPFAVGGSPTPVPAPELAYTVPGPEAFDPRSGTAPAILFAGVLCADGTPSLTQDAQGLPTCEGEAATREVVSFSVPVVVGEQPANQHPTLRDETITIDGAVWEAPQDEAPSACAAVAGTPSLPRVPLRDEEMPSDVVFTSDPADRERFQELVFTGEMPTLMDAREDLEITHLATAGQFERLTTEVFDDEAPDPEVDWEHPAAEDVPAEGLAVRFFFVVRDGRGGMDWTERVACVVP